MVRGCSSGRHCRYRRPGANGVAHEPPPPGVVAPNPPRPTSYQESSCTTSTRRGSSSREHRYPESKRCRLQRPPPRCPGPVGVSPAQRYGTACLHGAIAKQEGSAGSRAPAHTHAAAEGHPRFTPGRPAQRASPADPHSGRCAVQRGHVPARTCVRACPPRRCRTATQRWTSGQSMRLARKSAPRLHHPTREYRVTPTGPPPRA